MPITEEQRERRRKHLCSSDSSAVLMCNPYMGPYDVYLSKKHQLANAEGEHFDRGNRLERPLVDFAAEQWGLDHVEYDLEFQNGIWMAHTDGLHSGESRIVIEAKSTDDWRRRDEWGEEGTDEVPDEVYIQCQHHMFLSDSELALVPVIGPKGLKFLLYVVKRNEAVIASMQQQCEPWWEEHIVGDKPPRNLRPSIETTKRIPRDSERVVSLPPEVVQQYLKCADQKRALGKELDAEKARVQAEMGDASIIDYGDEEWVLVEEQRKRRGVDLKALERDHPEIVEQYRRVTSFSVLGRKKRKNVLKEDSSYE